MTDVISRHIEIVQGSRGPKARIAGHSVRVVDIVHMHEGQGWSPAEIVEQIPTISLADVYAALAYYHDHRAEIEQYIADEAAYVERLRRASPSLLPEKLKQRRDG